MPKWEASQDKRAIHPVHVIILLVNVGLVFWSISLLLVSQGFGTILFFGLAFSFFIFYMGRIYGELTADRDYIEVTSEGVGYRNTPAFGEGWLPQSGFLPFSQIHSADIVSIQPFYNPEVQRMAIMLQVRPAGRILLGNNLTEEQIIRVGLALQGSVTLSRALRKLLGSTDGEEPLKDIIDIGKAIWRNLQNREK